MTDRIDTVEARAKLKARPAIYWQRLSTGQHIGLRKLSPASSGTWIARAYDDAAGKQIKRSLGAFDDLPANKRFDAAKKAAEEWFDHLGRGGTAETITVRKACENYVDHVRDDLKAEDRANDIDARFKRRVYRETIAKMILQKINKQHVDAWRRKLEKTPVVANPYAAVEDQVTRERSKSSVNRDMTALRAALNHAHDSGAVTTDMAWRVALRPAKNVDGRRDIYLDRAQRRALIEKAPTDVAQLLTGMSLLPLRPGALAGLTVANFDKRLGVLVIGKDKAGKDRRIKLPKATAAFIEGHAKDKTPAAPLLARADGLAWTKDAWKKPIKAAALAAELPAATTAYAMRHSVITDLVTNGLDLLTVAQLSGTSVAMIEKHYGHHRQDHAAAALAELAL
jgi:site-specific recombinase XerD